MAQTGFVDVEGGRLHYRDTGAGETTIVWVHGLPLDGSTWQAQVDHFDGYRNIAIDLRGYGLSSKLPPDAGGVTAIYVDDLIRLLDHLGLRRVVIVGHASGGHGVLRFAALHPERVARVIVINASPKFRQSDDWPWGFDDAAMERLLAIYNDQGLEAFIDVIISPDEVFKAAHPEIAHSFVQSYREMAMDAGAETLLAFFNDISLDDDRPLLKEIEAPTLLISGMLDNEVPPDVGLYLRNAIARATLVELSDSDHFVYATRPRLTNGVIEAFLEQQLEGDDP